jgi:hypothetical protein
MLRPALTASVAADLDRPGIAIISGAWNQHTRQLHRQCFANILNCIDSRPEISVILLNAAHVHVGEALEGVNLWYSHAREIFQDKQGVDYVRRLWKQHPRAYYDHEPLIRDHDYGGKTCVMIWEQWQLEYLLNREFAQHENIWYMGIGLGVRRDPIGWGQLCDLIRHQHVEPRRVLIKQDCVLDNMQDTNDHATSTFQHPELATDQWSRITDDIYVRTTLDW